jgi:hypothetical protein
VPDVAAVTVTPATKDAEVSVVTVTPEHSAQTVSTAELVNRTRDGLPAAEQGTDLQVYVGGTTASNIDASASVAKRLPLYLVVIAVRRTDAALQQRPDGRSQHQSQTHQTPNVRPRRISPTQATHHAQLINRHPAEPPFMRQSRKSDSPRADRPVPRLRG